MATTSPPSNPGGDTPHGSDSDRVRDTAREDWDGVKSKVREDFDDVKREVRQEFEDARHAAGHYAEDQKNLAAGQIEGFASVFDRVGQELRQGEQSWAGRYANTIAEQLEGVASHTRSRSVSQLVGDVERFGRERPTAFLAGAALLGFAATRFFSASASRQTSEYARSPGRTSDTFYEGSHYGRGQARPSPAQPRGAAPDLGGAPTDRPKTEGEQS
ncbi:hypothetical protein SAMN04487974_1263 [Pelagibacterium luteolum]|uniref:Uncharacterized protein n=1 Tax=Pelagibacterium luteolum TaxID=440168 RepID=A0A1G8A4K6_9HYPH|nr:hypothetical protein SAMN04487974_1263 [Pelagibacterium luteolum]